MPPLHFPCIPLLLTGPIRLDADVIGELRATGSFKELSPSADEAEHSLELHLPYLAHVLRGQEWSLVPVVVGALSTESGEPWWWCWERASGCRGRRAGGR